MFCFQQETIFDNNNNNNNNNDDDDDDDDDVNNNNNDLLTDPLSGSSLLNYLQIKLHYINYNYKINQIKLFTNYTVSGRTFKTRGEMLNGEIQCKMKKNLTYLPPQAVLLIDLTTR